MADEAFALSPISARAALPSEEDYEAISEAFMETSRGRWFLGEYAKRNRNADTRMVLDAVARIEETLAAQQQPPQDSGLEEALAAIGSAVDEARSAADAALDGLALEQNLAPVRKGARVIREISWRLREIGADGRICDLIDSQVSAIEAGCGQISQAGARSELSTAFDLIEGRIARFGDEITGYGEGIAGYGEDDAAPVQTVEEATATASSTRSDEIPAATRKTIEAATVTVEATENAEVTMDVEALPAEAAVAAAEALETAETLETAEAAEASAEAAEMATEVMEGTSEVMAEAADAFDEALLDMIALEMAAPDPDHTDDAFENDTDETYIAEVAAAGPEIIAPMPEPLATPPPAPAIQPAPQASLQPSIKPSPEPSLGSSLIASGIVRRPTASLSDPLAPIRRMSQAEKIAFFS